MQSAPPTGSKYNQHINIYIIYWILVSHLSTDWFNHIISKHWLKTEPTTCFTIIVLPLISSRQKNEGPNIPFHRQMFFWLWEPRQHPAKDHMLPVQPRSCGKGDEELWPRRGRCEGDVFFGPRLMGFSSRHIEKWGFSRFHLGNWGKLRVTVSF